jgi:hypothetical protein
MIDVSLADASLKTFSNSVEPLDPRGRRRPRGRLRIGDGLVSSRPAATGGKDPASVVVGAAPGRNALRGLPASSPRPRWPPASSSSSRTATGRGTLRRLQIGRLVRIDEVFFAGGALVVGGDGLELKRLVQRHHPCVSAGERHLQFGGDARTQLLRLDRSDLL